MVRDVPFGALAARALATEAAEPRCGPGELETSVAAATAGAACGSSGGPSELFVPATAGAAQLRRSWKRPAAAERHAAPSAPGRTASAAPADAPTGRRLERPAVAACGNATGGLWRGHEEEIERDETPRERE